jgi:uncharacterized delta-60 repeat protein
MASAAGIVVLLSACVLPGDIDTSFGTKGVANIDTGGGAQEAHLALTPDGKIIVGAAVQYVSNVDTLFVTRLRSNGTIDTSFGNSGSTTEPFATPGGSVEDLAVQPDGKILVFEELEQGVNALVRLDANGALDTTFANHGTFSPSSMYGGSVAFVPGTTPRIVAVGRTPDIASVRLQGLSLDGKPDHNFGLNGTFDFNWAGANSSPGGIEVGPGGRLLVPGTAYAQQGVEVVQEPALAALTPGGQLDASFAGAGRIVLQTAEAFGGASAAFDPNGRILVTWNKVVQRLLANGSVDQSYGTNGVASFPAPPVPQHLSSASKILSDGAGRAVLIAEAFNPNMHCVEVCPPIATVARLSTSGATDATFAHGAGLAFLSPYTRIDDAVVAPTGLLTVPEPSNISVIRLGL